MKTCDCGGIWYRHGVTRSKRFGVGIRYQCKDCKKTITVRDGEVARHTLIKDWRHEVEQGRESRVEERGVLPRAVPSPGSGKVSGVAWLESPWSIGESQ